VHRAEVPLRLYLTGASAPLAALLEARHGFSRLEGASGKRQLLEGSEGPADPVAAGFVPVRVRRSPVAFVRAAGGDARRGGYEVGLGRDPRTIAELTAVLLAAIETLQYLAGR